MAAGLLAVGRTVYLAELPDTVNSQAAMALFDQLDEEGHDERTRVCELLGIAAAKNRTT